MNRFLLVVVIAFFQAGHLAAQQKLRVATNPKSLTGTGTEKYYYGNQNEPPRAIEFREGSVTTSYFISNIHTYLGISAELTFTEIESNADQLGMRHHLLQQYHKGIPIEGMTYHVHEKDNFVRSANGKAIRNLKLDTQTTLSERSAFSLAAGYLNTTDTTTRSGKKLIVSKGFKFTPESFVIAYQFDIDVSLIERWRISIDAKNGQLVNKVSLVNSCGKEISSDPGSEPLPYRLGSGKTRYYGTQTIRVEDTGGNSSRLSGRTEHGGAIGTFDFRNGPLIILLLGFPYNVSEFYSQDTTFNDPYHRNAVSVHWGAEKVYEYYYTKHNRNSFDNLGSQITSYVHVDQQLDNAYWTGRLLAFGDGSNNNPLVELDVVSHEFTHGVTQYEAGLQYYYEPGALNESFSDIMGKAIEFNTFGDTATWLIAKHYAEGGLRDFANPNLKNQPDTYQGTLWYTGDGDYGGVHYNSGVQNFWFYLLCKGGSGVNDHQRSYSVNPIGIDAAAKVVYRNLTEYLGSASDYLDSRIGSMLAAADLYGKNSAIYKEVDNAWDAVGVIDEPIITSLEVYDITATTAKIKGSLLPRGSAVKYHFEYGPTPALGSSSEIYDYTDAINAKLTGLQSDTKYFLRLVAQNDNGTTFYNSEFKTISLAPLVKIKNAIDVTETSATFRGEINPNSLVTSFRFEYGITPALGETTASYPLSDTTEYLNVSVRTENLQPRKTYYCRLTATNNSKSSSTTIVSFFTGVRPVISGINPSTAQPGAEIVITGENFNTASEKNVVHFGAVRATVLSSTSSEIKVKVPTGASFGPLTLTDTESGLVTESSTEFVPTFSGAFTTSSLQLRVGLDDAPYYDPKIVDIDSDGKPDIVVGHGGGFSVFQNINQGGDINAQSFVRNTYSAQDFYTNDLEAVDVDGNGLKDIVGRYAGGIRIYPNQSVPGYIFFGVPLDLPMQYLEHLTFGDFDMDGHIDIAGTTRANDSTQVTIYRNQNPKGSLTTGGFDQRFRKAIASYVYFLTSADVNNDGASDLVVGTYNENFFSILQNKGRPGAFHFEEHIIQHLNRGRFARYFASDLNADGWADLISSPVHEIGNVSVFENKKMAPDILVGNPVVALGDYESSSLANDIDGDGKVDLLAFTDQRQFHFLKNNTVAGQPISDASFEKFASYGMVIPNSWGSVLTTTTVNDLNGDGRPEVINAHSYYYGPHDGYQLEIWQNSVSACIDPTIVTVRPLTNSAIVEVPANISWDDLEIDFSPEGSSDWWRVYSPTIYNLYPGQHYRVRVRAKCYLDFTPYHYINFAAECVDLSGVSVSNVSVNFAYFSAPDFGALEVQYAVGISEDWATLYSPQITDLLPGTTYRVRFRGRCATPTEFKLIAFVTLCPSLSALTISSDVTHNSATVNVISNYPGDVLLEYSMDNYNWQPVDASRIISPLVPGSEYFVRGQIRCTDRMSEYMITSFYTPCPVIDKMDITSITPFSADISWTNETMIKEYTLTYSADGGPVTTLETTSTSLHLSDLTPGTNYTIRIALNCSLNQTYFFHTFSTVCFVPTKLTASNVTTTTADLSWIDNFGGMPFHVEYAIKHSDVWLIAQTPSTSISLTELRPGTKYEARVHIECSEETAAYASIFFETKLYDETTYYPNPTQSKIAIRPSKDLIGHQFNLIDHVGRIITSGTLRDYTLDLTPFPPGLYTLNIDGEKPLRIVKN